MNTTHPIWRRWSWVAFLAIWAVVFAPTVSAMVRAAGGNGWVEVCSAQGSRWLSPEDAATSSPTDGQNAPAASSGAQCPLCLVAALPALPTLAGASDVPAPVGTLRWAVVSHETAPSIWLLTRPQPRAPPLA